MYGHSLQQDRDVHLNVARHEDFTGREWVFNQINHWLANNDAPPLFIITGEPGIGKSAIAEYLARRHKQAVSHFCVGRDSKTLDPLTFVRSISLQLAERYQSFAQALANLNHPHISVQVAQQITTIEHGAEVKGIVIEHLHLGSLTAQVAFVHTVLQPLQTLLANSGYDQPIIVIIDALDEAVRYQGGTTIVDLLATTGQLPRQIRFVLTTRPENMVLRYFEQIPCFRLDAGRPENLNDIKMYIRNQVNASETLRRKLDMHSSPIDTVIEAIATASKGNFLYLVWLLPSIANGAQSIDVIEDLPQGLGDIYREFLRTRPVGENIVIWQTRFRSVLGVLSAAQDSLNLDQISTFSLLNKQETRDTIASIRQFLDPQNYAYKRYQLYHQSVIDFLTSEEHAQEFYIELDLVHSNITQHYLELFRAGTETAIDSYGRNYLVHHLVAQGFDGVQQALKLVGENHWISMKYLDDASGLSYLQDVNLLLSVNRTSCTNATQSSALASGERRWSQFLPNIVYLTSLHCSVIGHSTSMPIEAVVGYAKLGKVQDALRLTEMMTNRYTYDSDQYSCKYLDITDHILYYGRRAEAYRRIAEVCFEKASSPDQKNVKEWLSGVRAGADGVTAEIRKFNTESEISGDEIYTSPMKGIANFLEMLNAANMLEEIQEILNQFEESEQMDLIHFSPKTTVEEPLMMSTEITFESANAALNIIHNRHFEFSDLKGCALAETIWKCNSVLGKELTNKWFDKAIEITNTNARTDFRIPGLARVAIFLYKCSEIQRAIELIRDGQRQSKVGDYAYTHDVMRVFNALAFAAAHCGSQQLLTNITFQCERELEWFGIQDQYYLTVCEIMVKAGHEQKACEIVNRQLRNNTNKEWTIKKLLNPSLSPIDLSYTYGRFLSAGIEDGQDVDTPEKLDKELVHLKSESIHYRIGEYADTLAKLIQQMGSISYIEGIDDVVNASYFSFDPRWKHWADVWDNAQTDVICAAAQEYLRMDEFQRLNALAQDEISNYRRGRLVYFLVQVIVEKHAWHYIEWLRSLADKVTYAPSQEMVMRRMAYLYGKAGQHSESLRLAKRAIDLAFETLGSGIEMHLFDCLLETCEIVASLDKVLSSEKLMFMLDVLHPERLGTRAQLTAIICAQFPILASIGDKDILVDTWNAFEAAQKLWRSLVDTDVKLASH